MQTQLRSITNYVERLSKLLFYLHEITHLQLSLHDTAGVELYSIQSRSAFCDLICDSPEGHARCVACDRRAVTFLKERNEPSRYRCHVGLIDIAVPITEEGQPILFILLGQILDDTPVEEQWKKTSALCGWHRQPVALEEAFEKLPRLSTGQIHACIEIIYACVSEVRLQALLQERKQTESERLLSFIEANYATELSLDRIAKALSMSKSKLCSLAGDIEPRETLMNLITGRRIKAAMQLLKSPDAVIREVAEAVGIPDYNYFTKVFKKRTGMTPSEYRRKR